MGVARQSINRVCHWLGLIPAMLLLAFAVRLVASDWGNIDADEKNEYWGVVYALPIAGVALYLFIRSIGWFIAELVD
jgi:hypothetical protein